MYLNVYKWLSKIKSCQPIILYLAKMKTYEYIFIQTKANKIHSQPICTIRNAKGNSLGLRGMILDEHVNLQ